MFSNRRHLEASNLGRRQRRRGATLMEVLIALGIFVAGWAAIGQLMSIGLDSAQRTKMATHARFRCESIAAQWMLKEDLRPGTTTGRMNKDWTWKVTIKKRELSLVQVDVLVRHLGGAQHEVTFLQRSQESP